MPNSVIGVLKGQDLVTVPAEKFVEDNSLTAAVTAVDRKHTPLHGGGLLKVLLTNLCSWTIIYSTKKVKENVFEGL